MKILHRFEEISYALVNQVHGREYGCRHFAFLFNKNKIIAIGWNKFRSHPFNRRHKYHEKANLHAESDVLIKSKIEDFSKVDMAVLRINRNEELTLSKPCEYCEGAISTLGIRRVWFTNINGNWDKL